MESPPPIPGKKKSNTALIVILILLGLGVCCGGPVLLLGGGAWFAFQQGVPLVSCGMGIKDLQLSVMDYSQAHDGVLPKAATWEDDIRPYYVKRLAKHKDMGPITPMPAAGPWGCSANGTTTGFAFNQSLSGKKLADIADRSTPLLFEVPNAGHNLSQAYKELDPSTSPKILGNPRGWYQVSVEGDAFARTPKGNQVRINTNVN